MKNRILKTLSNLASVAVIAAMFSAIPTGAANAVAVGGTIANGIATSDLNSVGTTAASLAQELAGAGVTVSNVSYKGANSQLGTIDIVDPNVVSFNHGVIMSSGHVSDVVGPNKSESTTSSLLWGGSEPGINAGDSDADLTALIAGAQTVNPMTYDAASLSFDFVPNSSTVYFTYVFGSDEYLEWVNLFDDVFAFYVNGTNCAVAPDANSQNGGTLPVSIDSINSNVNPSMYRDNSFWNPPTNPLNIETDGLTVEMVCQASVNPGVVNHMKLAIADTSDSILDSTVMIKAGSLSTTKPELCFNGIDDDNNTAVDMDDNKCKTTITPAPAGQSGVGNTTPPAGATPPPAVDPAPITGQPIDPGQPVVPYSGAPAFTGNEGTPILLDISAQGWKMSSDTLKTYWEVTGINGTTGTCTVYGGSNAATAVSMIAGNPAPAYAVCPNEGEYVAHIWGLDFESKSSDDKDLDFFVHNAAPAANMMYPIIDPGYPYATYAVGDQVDIAASAVDPGVNDTISCSLNWGDGTVEAGSYDTASQACYGTHFYDKPGTMLISTTVTDDFGSSSATATVITVESGTGSLFPQNITLNADPAATAAYGDGFVIDATPGDSGNALEYLASGSCENTGATVTMTSGAGDCTVTIDQAGGQFYEAAPTITVTVSATQRAITVTAAAKTKVAGTNDPAFTQTVTSGSLINGDALTGALSRTAGETPGTYAITQGSLTAGDNYAITYVGANLTITGTAPAVATQPTAQTVAAGSSVTFTAAASGNPAPSVQWQVANAGTSSYSNITGANSASYTFTPTTANNGKLYRAQFSNGVGSTVNSNGVALTVYGITSFTPAAAAVGATVTITGTSLTGTTSVKFNGLAATSFTVVSATSITAVVPAGVTTGAISVSNATLTSNSATNFSLAVAPAVTLAPVSQAVTAGTTVNLTAAATGSPAPTVAWQSSTNGTTWTAIGGATSTTYSFVAATADNNKQFRAVFSNGVGTAANSAAAIITIYGLTSFTPASAAVGATVTITGTNLTGTTGVKFNGVSATTFTVVSATSVTAVVPVGATAGTINIIKGSLTATSATSFTVVVAPSVTLAPVSQTVTVGTTVTLTAAGAGSPAPTVAWQSSTNGTTWTAITGATSTTYSFVAAATDNNKQFRAVFSNGVGTAANSAAAVITVLGVTSFTPAVGPVGTVVTLTGTGFTGVTAVKFNGTSALTFTVVSATSITATVPAGASSGTISVVKGATAVSATNYLVGIAPKVTTTAPTSGGVGTAVTLTGTGFTGVTSVKFTGTTVSAPFKIVSDTTILTVVPSGATAGVITLTNSVTTANTASFSATATLVVPTVTAYSVSSARAGNAATTTLTGTNLAGATAVALNGVSLTFTALTATTLSVSVPATGVASGPIRVTTGGGTSVNTIVFNVMVAATSLAAGTSHSCAVLADGTAKCWGLNTNGQLGNGTTTQATSPVLVTGLTGVSSIAAGSAFSCAVINSGATGTAKCWGLNTNGQLGNGTTTQSTSAVAVTGLTNVVSISTGTSHACAVLFDGTAKCWGLNTNGQLGNATTTQATSPVVVTGLTGVSSIAAGANSTCAVLTSGAVKCWGLNTNGQLGNGTTTQATSAVAVTGIDGSALKATAVAVGTSYACARINDGTERCWGLNTSGQLGDGTLVQKTTPVIVKLNANTNLTGVSKITAGATHTCAITGSGSTATAVCWGANGNGRLGNAASTNSSYAVAVVATLTTGISAIAAGGSHTISLAPSTNLPPTGGVSWGANTNGQLGTGATTAVTTPTALNTL